MVSRKEHRGRRHRVRRIRSRTDGLSRRAGARDLGPARRARRRDRVRRAPAGGDAGLSSGASSDVTFGVDLHAVARTARLRAAVRPGGRRRGRPGEPAPVRRGVAVQRGDVRHLRRRLPADSARRSDLHVDRQRDDGEDGRGDRRAGRRTALRVVARHDLPARDRSSFRWPPCSC